MFKAFLFLVLCVSAVVLHFYSCTWSVGAGTGEATVVTLPGTGSRNVNLSASYNLKTSGGWSRKQKAVIYGIVVPIGLLATGFFIWVNDNTKKLKKHAPSDAKGRQEHIPLKSNGFAVTGFILGLVSIFLAFIGMLPILAVIFSTIGLFTFKPMTQKNRWMAIVGLVLGVLYTFSYLQIYGHIPGME